MVAVRCASPELYWLRVDANSNLLTLTPPGRPAHSFSYDGRDLTTQYAPPAVTPGGPTSYAWNADMQPTTTTQPDGDVVSSWYDLAGKLSSLAIPRGSFGYTYDGPTGKLASVIGPGGSSRSYGYQGSLLASLSSSGPVSGSAAWTYDNNYRTTGRTVNGANGISFGYDADDLSTAIGSLTLGRNAQNGLLTGTTLGSVTDALTYSTFAEVSGYTASVGVDQLYSESYVRDDLGRITQRTETIQGSTTTWAYSYDVAGRLVSVTRNGAAFESYTYDPNDNRLTKTTAAGTTTYAHDDQDRLLSAVGPEGAESWVYDGHGDLLSHNGSAGQTSFDYETGGQLLSVTKPGGDVVSYEMDAGNKRAVKRVNGVVQRQWVYAGGLLPVAELDASGNLVAVFNGGFMVKNGTTYRLLRDHLGSVRMVVDTSTGTVVQRLSYDAWGNVLEDTNPGFQPFGYAGGLYDPDTGLVRFGARDYDSRVGRWTSKDPITFQGDTNRYGYCTQDPINFTDLTGLDKDIVLVIDPAVIQKLSNDAHVNVLPENIVNQFQISLKKALGKDAPAVILCKAPKAKRDKGKHFYIEIFYPSDHKVSYNDSRGGIVKLDMNSIAPIAGEFASVRNLINDSLIESLTLRSYSNSENPDALVTDYPIVDLKYVPALINSK